MDIVIPSLGDIDEVEVIEICVSVGDTVAIDDAIVVIESDKASMELPSTAMGKIVELKVALGDMVSEGHVVAVVASESTSESTSEPAPEEAPATQAEFEEGTEETSAVQPAPAQVPQADEGARQSQPATSQSPSADADAAIPTESASSSPQELATSQPDTQAKTVEVLVPDIGDANDVVVIEVAVKQGDAVEVDDLLVVLESDKASMEIAAEHAGTVVRLGVAEGDEVIQGAHILTLELELELELELAPQSVAERQTLPEPDPTPQSEATTRTESEPVSAESRDILDAVKRPEPSEPSEPSKPSEPSHPPAPSKPSELADPSQSKVYAGPAVRRLARELGVPLTSVVGTGNRGRITKDDVKAFVKQHLAAEPSPDSAGIPQVASIDFTKFGEIELVAMSRIRVRGADNLHRSWINLPHVTQHDEADMTDLEDFRQSLKAEAQSRGVKITPLSFLVKACCHALHEFAQFNSSLHEDRAQLVLKKFINIGLAVDTPEGLVVPVIKGADRKGIWELSAEIGELSDKARTKKLAIDDLQGGTFTISSLGAIGGTGFTPIINAPEVAILGVARLTTKPVWNGHEFLPRQMLPLSLSYDHRVINGADGGRFMGFLTSILSDIRRLAL